MRLRSGILALVLAASLAACGDDDPKASSSDPSSPATSAAPSDSATPLDPSEVDPAKCAKFLEGQAKAAELSSKLAPGSNIEDAIAAANAQFDALKEGAPADIQESLDAVKAAYTTLGELYADPMKASDPAAAADIEKASKDLQDHALKLNNWITENCS